MARGARRGSRGVPREVEAETLFNRLPYVETFRRSSSPFDTDAVASRCCVAVACCLVFGLADLAFPRWGRFGGVKFQSA